MNAKETSRPPEATDKHLDYLDALRKSGMANMWGAGAFLKRDFPELSIEKANDVLGYWMATFPRIRK